MILVTGATGNLGRNLVKNIVASEVKLRVFVRNAQAAQEMLRGNIEIVEGNLNDVDALKRAMAGVNLIYHCAANIKRDAPYQILHRDNVEGTENVIDAAEGRKVVHVSSTAVYGKNAKSPISEDSPYNPTDNYGKSKAEADKLALREGAIVVRPTYIYGSEFTRAMFELLKLIEKRRMPIVGRGWNRLHFVHVSDVVQGLLLAAEKGRQGQAYNIAGPDMKSQEELLSLFAKYLGVNAPKHHVPVFFAKLYANLLGSKYSEYAATIYVDRVFDITKARKELGYNPKINYEVGMKEVVASYKASRSK